MSKFIQIHFFYSTFSLPTKQKREKLKYFLFSYLSILSSFSILLLFHPFNQTDFQYQWTIDLSILNEKWYIHNIFIIFLQQILSSKLLLVTIVGAKKKNLVLDLNLNKLATNYL